MLNNQWSLVFSLYNVNNKNFIGGSMSKEQEYQQKLEIIKDILNIDYSYTTIFEFEREIEKIDKEIEINNNEILYLESEIEDLEDKINDLENENKKLKQQL